MLRQAIPLAMWVEFEALDPTEKTVFIANGQNSMYIQEWVHIYIQVVSLVKYTYNHILNSIDNM